MRYLLICCLIFAAGCQKKVTEELTYREMMGEKTSKWQFIATPEDRAILDQVETIYIENLKKEKRHEIPQVAHYIWLGPKEFPQSSKEYVASWIRNNPQLTFKFWTDRERPAPHPKMEVVYFDQYPYETFKDEYAKSDNWAERSDLLRYEILFQEGGLYIDHDVVCFKNVGAIDQKYDFYCGIEPPHSPIIKSSLSVCNNLVGTVPAHPILSETIQRVKSGWQEMTEAYPGTDRDSIRYRVAHRTFAPFDESVRHRGVDPKFKNGVLPAGYFNEIENSLGLFADHKYTGTWYQEVDPFEDLVRRRLVKMTKKSNKTLLLSGISLALNTLLGGYLLYALRRKTDANA